jgi:nuclear transport factor 2 (NTF2) superfamily protein
MEKMNWISIEKIYTTRDGRVVVRINGELYEQCSPTLFRKFGNELTGWCERDRCLARRIRDNSIDPYPIVGDPLDPRRLL